MLTSGQNVDGEQTAAWGEGNAYRKDEEAKMNANVVWEQQLCEANTCNTKRT